MECISKRYKLTISNAMGLDPHGSLGRLKWLYGRLRCISKRYKLIFLIKKVNNDRRPQSLHMGGAGDCIGAGFFRYMRSTDGMVPMCSGI